MSPLTTVLLLTSKFYAKNLIDVLVEKSPETAVIFVEHPNEILQFGGEFLSGCRMISFGSRFYVKPEVLDLISYKSYNFHPGPTNYPGWAPFNFALYDKSPDFGVTLHEMTADIDTGPIVGSKTFDIPAGCDVQRLMDLTTEAMYQLFDELSLDIAKGELPLPSIDLKWSGHIWTKKDFEQICRLNLDLSKEELEKRLHAFGSSDGINLPHLVIDKSRYFVAEPDDDPTRTFFEFHGHRFIKMS